MRRFNILFVLVMAVLFMAAATYAQTQEPTEIDPAVVQTILAGGLLGFGVIALTQVVKKALHVEGGIVVYGVSLVMSAAATIVFLITGGGGFTILKFVGYTVSVWAVANGWYKFKTA
jgi:hypothetical protein